MRALREFEERVVLAAEATHHGVWELDTATNELWMSDKARAFVSIRSRGVASTWRSFKAVSTRTIVRFGSLP